MKRKGETKEEYAKRCKLYYSNNSVRINERKRQRRAEDGDHIRAYFRQYNRKYMKDNPQQATKQAIRIEDRWWCINHIPSSIMWKVELHHKWDNGGVMYLLDPEEHRRITKQEVKERWMKRRAINQKLSS